MITINLPTSLHSSLTHFLERSHEHTLALTRFTLQHWTTQMEFCFVSNLTLAHLKEKSMHRHTQTCSHWHTKLSDTPRSLPLPLGHRDEVSYLCCRFGSCGKLTQGAKWVPPDGSDSRNAVLCARLERL